MGFEVSGVGVERLYYPAEGQGDGGDDDDAEDGEDGEDVRMMTMMAAIMAGIGAGGEGVRLLLLRWTVGGQGVAGRKGGGRARGGG